MSKSRLLDFMLNAIATRVDAFQKQVSEQLVKFAYHQKDIQETGKLVTEVGETLLFEIELLLFDLENDRYRARSSDLDELMEYVGRTRAALRTLQGALGTPRTKMSSTAS